MLPLGADDNAKTDGGRNHNGHCTCNARMRREEVEPALAMPDTDEADKAA